MAEFNVTLGNYLATIPRATYTYIVGDTNVDLLEPNAVMEEYCAVLQSLSYLPVITVPTRVVGNSVTLLDHMWTNQLHEVVSGAIEVAITDHFPTFLSTFHNIDSSSMSIQKTFRDHSELSITNLKNEMELYLINSRELREQINNSELINQNFSDNLFRIYDKNCKLRSKCISRSSLLKPWINNEIKVLINQKHSLFRRYKRGEIEFRVYNNHKNYCVRALRRAKQNYFRFKFEASRGNIRESWRNIKYLTNTTKKITPLPKVNYNNRILHTPKSVVSAFSDHFATVAANLDEKIPTVNKSPIDYLGNP